MLVQGGAGGIGMCAVQLAAFLGGHVTATGRSGDAGFVRDLGAERFISADDGQSSQAGGGFDVVIDTVGGAVLDESYGLLREGGRLVTLGAPPDQDLACKHKVRAMFFVVEPDPDELARLADMASTGKLREVISQTFPLAEGQRELRKRPRNPASRQDRPHRSLIRAIGSSRADGGPVAGMPHASDGGCATQATAIMKVRAARAPRRRTAAAGLAAAAMPLASCPARARPGSPNASASSARQRHRPDR